MKMTIEEAITWLNTDDYESKGFADATSIAIDTMRKYQKIQEIVEHWACCGNPSDSMIAISEVLEDDEKSD